MTSRSLLKISLHLWSKQRHLIANLNGKFLCNNKIGSREKSEKARLEKNSCAFLKTLKGKSTLVNGYYKIYTMLGPFLFFFFFFKRNFYLSASNAVSFGFFPLKVFNCLFYLFVVSPVRDETTRPSFIFRGNFIAFRIYRVNNFMIFQTLKRRRWKGSNVSRFSRLFRTTNTEWLIFLLLLLESFFSKRPGLFDDH